MVRHGYIEYKKMMASKAIFRMDMGFHIETILWALFASYLRSPSEPTVVMDIFDEHSRGGRPFGLISAAAPASEPGLMRALGPKLRTPWRQRQTS